MTCTHANTTVKNSRHPDALTSHGKPWYGRLPYPCEVIRTRKCLDCGETFRTHEVRKDVLDSLMAAGDPDAILSAIRDYLKERGL